MASQTVLYWMKISKNRFASWQEGMLAAGKQWEGVTLAALAGDCPLDACWRSITGASGARQEGAPCLKLVKGFPTPLAVHEGGFDKILQRTLLHCTHFQFDMSNVKLHGRYMKEN